MAKAAGLDAFETNQEVEVIDTSKKVKIGIIGTGWIAGQHADNLKKMEDVEVVALADIVPGKAEAFAQKFEFNDARIYNSDEELLEAEKDLDCVTICTYNCQHAPCAIHALKKGRGYRSNEGRKGKWKNPYNRFPTTYERKYADD